MFRLLALLLMLLSGCTLNLHLTQEELEEKYGPLEAGESIFEDKEEEEENGSETRNKDN